MKILHLDLETYSSVRLDKCGVYAYAASPDFEVLLCAWAFDDGPITVTDYALGESLPEYVIAALTDDGVLKMAHNAQFERVCLSAWLRNQLHADSWYCTAVHAAACGYPLRLDDAAKILLPPELQKNGRGKALIRKFCGPCEPTKANGFKSRIRPADAPLDWADFKDYNRQDVVAERALEAVLAAFPLFPGDGPLYALDQAINDRGVRIDRQLVFRAIKADAAYADRLIAEALELAPDMTNPKSVSQMKAWLRDEYDLEVESLNKKTVPALIKKAGDDVMKRVLKIRQELAKTSVTKYQAMARALADDDRVRGLLQFCGAGRTGRWAGRLVQVQNLPQNHLPDLERARELIREGDFETVEMLFPSLPVVLSELIRTAFIPADGCKFVVADFSAIEARVISWLAGEEWRLDVFRTHGKIYEASAAQMFKVPLESITKTSPLRQRGKVAELALGYQGGENAMITMGALDNGLTRDELKPLVNKWRAANKKIVKLWARIEQAAMAVLDGEPRARVGPVSFSMRRGSLLVTLPSGRVLAYANARLEPHQKWEGRWSIVYDGVGQERKSWGRLDTYGGKLTENIVQAISRDLLAYSMLNLEAAGYRIVMHVHDEVVLEEPLNKTDALNDACRIMGEGPAWADGLPLRADGFECLFYKKD